MTKSATRPTRPTSTMRLRPPSSTADHLTSSSNRRRRLAGIAIPFFRTRRRSGLTTATVASEQPYRDSERQNEYDDSDDHCSPRRFLLGGCMVASPLYTGRSDKSRRARSAHLSVDPLNLRSHRTRNSKHSSQTRAHGQPTSPPQELDGRQEQLGRGETIGRHRDNSPLEGHRDRMSGSRRGA